ncbi:MAG TPA: metalloregulator ArsR/SmtB family transcription factor [Gemmatimonadales bacterium]|nr:metalloregulator ArsR/SmtB family transcription factor [Gemmatimonadales bacterium]
MPVAALPDTARTRRWFHALSDETRLEVVRLLSHGERCVCELQNVLDAAQSRLSFHLRVLKDAGLVTDRREGRWVYYALNRASLDQITAFAAAVQPGKHAGSCRAACCR